MGDELTIRGLTAQLDEAEELIKHLRTRGVHLNAEVQFLRDQLVAQTAHGAQLEESIASLVEQIAGGKDDPTPQAD